MSKKNADIRSFFGKPAGAKAPSPAKAKPETKAEPGVKAETDAKPAPSTKQEGKKDVKQEEKKAVKQEGKLDVKQEGRKSKYFSEGGASEPGSSGAAAGTAIVSKSAPAARPARNQIVISSDEDDDMEDAGGRSTGGKSSGGKAKGKAGSKVTAKPAARKKAKVVSDDDDDEDFVMADGDGSSSDDEGGLVEEEDEAVVLDSDEEEGKAKKAKAKVGAKRGREESKPSTKTPAPAAAAPAPAAKPSGRALPSSLKAMPAAAAAAPSAPTSPPPASASPAKKAAGTKRTPAGASGGSAAKRKSASGAAPALDENANKAIKAVEEAIQRLPPESEVKYALVEEGVDAAGNDATKPEKHGEKETPIGHPDCLAGKAFVISGVLDSLYRQEAEDVIRRHGGRITGSVSGKTSFLLVGNNCGRSKHRTALEKKTKLIDEDGLFSLIRASQPFVPKQAEEQQQQAAVGPGAAASSPSAAKPAAAGAITATAAGRPLSALAAGSFFGSGGASSSGAGPAKSIPPSQASGSGAKVASELWVDKHKPRTSAELVGNNTLVNTLRAWLNQWRDIHIKGMQPQEVKGGSNRDKAKELGKKAVLLSGPPGIGKTSSAHIIAKECGYHVVEMNASDTRNKSDSKITAGIAGKSSNIIKEMANNDTLFSAFGPAVGGPSAGLGQGRAGPGAHRQLLIMDEVDGMSGGDRGGIQDLIDTIKKSKIPIICICNDKHHQKLKSLRNHCLELEYRKPTPLQVSKRLQDICGKEGLRVNDATMTALVEGASGDLRLLLGQLQMVRLSRTTLTYDDVKGKQGTSKDTDLSAFECSRKLFEPSTALMSINDRLDYVFADDLVPLLVQENYVNHKPSIAGNDAERLRALAKAADAISAGDVLSRAVWRSQNWSLSPAANLMMGVVPTAYMRGGREAFFPGEMNFPRFTANLGNMSTARKQQRLLGEITTTMSSSGHLTSHKTAVRTEYLPALRPLLTAPLRLCSTNESDAAGITAAITQVLSMMSDYCISREQLDAVLDMTKFKTQAAWGADPMKDVATKVKSAFTRTFNQTGQMARCSLMLEAPVKGRARKGRGAAAAEEEEEEEGEGEEGSNPEQQQPQEQEEEEDEMDDANADALKRKLAKRGVSLTVKDSSTSGKGSGASGRGSRGGRGSAAGRSGGGGRGSGSGRGRGAAKK